LTAGAPARLSGADDPHPEHKLAALSAALLLIYALQSIASYYRNYWAGIAGNRLIFELRCKLFAHLQQLPHVFFDRNPSGAHRFAGPERRAAGA